MSPAIDMEFYEQYYYVTDRALPDLLFERGLEELARPEGAAAFIAAYAPEIKAKSPDVAATYFASWAGRLCAAYQYGLWHDGVKLDLAADNMVLQMHPTPKGTALSFRVKALRAKGMPDGAGTAWEEEAYGALSEFYFGHIRPLLEGVAAAGGVPAGTLWGLLATGMYYILDLWKGMVKEEDKQVRLEQLTGLLVNRLEPRVFGRARNPFRLKFRQVESLSQPGETVRLKAACCLAYKTDTDHGYCYTCPKITTEERDRIRQAYQAKG